MPDQLREKIVTVKIEGCVRLFEIRIVICKFVRLLIVIKTVRDKKEDHKSEYSGEYPELDLGKCCCFFQYLSHAAVSKCNATV